MIEAPKPENEQRRISALKALEILDTIEEQAYDDLTAIAAQICDAPIALVSLVDNDRQWFKSHHGLDARETPRDVAFCSHAILNDDVFIVEDSSNDVRFVDNPLATDAPNVKFYAGAPLTLDDDLRLGTLCVIDDHPRVLNEHQLEALRALARQVVSQLELRRKINDLRSLDEAKDEFIAMVSHELRTPLTSIKGSLALLSDKLDSIPDKLRNMLDIAVRNTERTLLIVNDILQLSKLEAGKFELEQEDLDIADLLEEAKDLNDSYCRQHGSYVELVIEATKAPMLIHGDKPRLIQVVSNLLSNAAKFSSEKTVIKLTCKPDKGNVKVEVINQGPGITEEDRDNLFKKFKQLGSSTNEKSPGTGLGLNISKHLIDIHQGEIGCISIMDGYTCFYFTLPLINRPNY